MLRGSTRSGPHLAITGARAASASRASTRRPGARPGRRGGGGPGTMRGTVAGHRDHRGGRAAIGPGGAEAWTAGSGRSGGTAGDQAATGAAPATVLTRSAVADGGRGRAASRSAARSPCQNRQLTGRRPRCRAAGRGVAMADRQGREQGGQRRRAGRNGAQRRSGPFAAIIATPPWQPTAAGQRAPLVARCRIVSAACQRRILPPGDQLASGLPTTGRHARPGRRAAVASVAARHPQARRRGAPGRGRTAADRGLTSLEGRGGRTR